MVRQQQGLFHEILSSLEALYTQVWDVQQYKDSVRIKERIPADHCEH
jgi:hypothetical protein